MTDFAVRHIGPSPAEQGHMLGSLGLIKSQGVNGGALAPDVAFAQIATRDIGHAAADALLAKDFTGATVRELLGERGL